jgi:hypothetical protein
MQIDPARFVAVVLCSIDLTVLSTGAERKEIGKSLYTRQEQRITTMIKR